MSSRNRCNRASWSALNAQQRQTKTPHIWKPQQPPCRRRQDKRATARLRACVKPAALFAKANLPSCEAKQQALRVARAGHGSAHETKREASRIARAGHGSTHEARREASHIALAGHASKHEAAHTPRARE